MSASEFCEKIIKKIYSPDFKGVEFDHFRKETRLLTTNWSQLKIKGENYGKD